MFGIFKTNRRSTGSRHCGKEEAMLGYNSNKRHGLETAEMARNDTKMG